MERQKEKKVSVCQAPTKASHKAIFQYWELSLGLYTYQGSVLQLSCAPGTPFTYVFPHV